MRNAIRQAKWASDNTMNHTATDHLANKIHTSSFCSFKAKVALVTLQQRPSRNSKQPQLQWAKNLKFQLPLVDQQRVHCAKPKAATLLVWWLKRYHELKCSGRNNSLLHFRKVAGDWRTMTTAAHPSPGQHWVKCHVGLLLWMLCHVHQTH